MYLIRLFKITGHLGQQLAIADTHIDGKTELAADLVANGMRNSDGVRVDAMSTSHIQKAFVDRHFLHYRRNFPADINEGL